MIGVYQNGRTFPRLALENYDIPPLIIPLFAYLYDKEPGLRAIKLAHVEDTSSQQSTFVFQDDNLRMFKWKTSMWTISSNLL